MSIFDEFGKHCVKSLVGSLKAEDAGRPHVSFLGGGPTTP